MSIAPFDTARKKLLFFSRGRGRGHAVVDIEIARQLNQLRGDVDVRFVSYGTGALTFRDQQIPVIDMGLPDANSIAATTVIAGRIIGSLQPDLVVAHEEFAALPPAIIFGVPTTMITDFFDAPGKFSMESLWFADHVLFLDQKGLFPEPPSVIGKVRYLGPALRNFEYRRSQRVRARGELGLPADATVIGIFPGSWTESMAPLADPVLAALDKIRIGPVHLLWLAGADANMLRALTGNRPNVTILDVDWRVDRLMVACNLAITKTNRMTVRELASLGIRTLSVSYGLNPVDEQCIEPIPSNRTIVLNDCTARTIRNYLSNPQPPPPRRRSRSCAAELAKLIGKPI